MNLGENMQKTMLLESIWQGDIYASRNRRNHEIARLLELTLPLDVIYFSAKSGVSRSCIVSEQIYLLPDIRLGDVLAEELDAEVPFGAMVVVFKERDWAKSQGQASISHELGLLVGDTLINLIKDCVFPIQCEREVLSVMANSYCRLIESPELQKQKVCSQDFREGLIIPLEEYCDGNPLRNLRGRHEIRKQVVNTSIVTKHMKSMESHVGKKMFGDKSINLTQLHGSILNGSDWRKSLSEAVMGELRRDAVPATNYFG